MSPEEYINDLKNPLHKHQNNIDRMVGIKPLEILKKYHMMDKVAVVNVEQSAETFIRHKSDETYKQYIKDEMTHKLAKECMKKATFLHIKTPPRPGSSTYDDQVRIIGRCIILSIDEFAGILMRIKR